MSASINTEYTITNKETGKSFTINDHSDPDNVIALQSFPTFAPDVRANEIQNQGKHGVHKLPFYYGGRSIIFNGIIVGLTEAGVWDLKKSVDEVLEFPVISPFANLVTIGYTDPNGLELEVDATLNSAISYDRNMKELFKLDFQILLRADNPFINVNDTVEDAKEYDGLLGYELWGFKLKTLIPFKLDKESINELTINVTGNHNATVKLYGSDDGDVVNPTIENKTNGQKVSFNLTLSGSAEYIELNGIDNTTTNQDGDDVSIYETGDDYIQLIDGDNIFAYTSSREENATLLAADFKVNTKRFII